MFMSSNIVARSYYPHKYLIFPLVSQMLQSHSTEEGPPFPRITGSFLKQICFLPSLQFSGQVWKSLPKIFKWTCDLVSLMTQVFHSAVLFGIYRSSFTDLVAIKTNSCLSLPFPHLCNFTHGIQWDHSYGATVFYLCQRHKKRQWVEVLSHAWTPHSPSPEHCRDREGDFKPSHPREPRSTATVAALSNCTRTTIRP